MVMARWTHLFPSRTQKLSTVVAKVSNLLVRIARCRAFFLTIYLMKKKRYNLIIFDSFLGLNEDFEFFNSIFVIFYFFEVFFFFLKIFILTFIVGCDKYIRS